MLTEIVWYPVPKHTLVAIDTPRTITATVCYPTSHKNKTRFGCFTLLPQASTQKNQLFPLALLRDANSNWGTKSPIKISIHHTTILNYHTNSLMKNENQNFQMLALPKASFDLIAQIDIFSSKIEIKLRALYFFSNEKRSIITKSLRTLFTNHFLYFILHEFL